MRAILCASLAIPHPVVRRDGEATLAFEAASVKPNARLPGGGLMRVVPGRPVTALLHHYQQHKYRRTGHNGMLEMWWHMCESSRADRHRFVAQRQGRVAFHKI